MYYRSVIAYLLALIAVRGDTWSTLAGEKFDGRLAGVYGPLVVIANKEGTRRIIAEALDDTATARIADYVASRPMSRPKWRASKSSVAIALKGKLGALHEAKLIPFDPADTVEPEFYVVFFGAGANEATRRFMPDLIARYEALKKVVGDVFEIIYVGRDGVPEDQTKFIRESRMPWPYVRFTALGGLKEIERWAESGIPTFVVLNASGDLVLDSVHPSGGVLSPDDVFKEFEALLSMMRAESSTSKRAMHRLTVLQHLRSNPTGEHAPRPYVLALDRGAYKTLATQRVIVTLNLDEFGKVADVSIEPKQDAVLLEQFRKDASRWLFLPSLRNGKAQEFVVKVPVEF